MATNPTSFALGPEDGEAFWGFGSLWTVKASAEQTGGRVSPGSGHASSRPPGGRRDVLRLGR